MPKLEYLMTYRADLEEPIEIGAVPSGSRQIYDVAGGSFEGPRLKGKLLASGGDWLLIGNDGVGRLDVRGTFETDDGARVYVQYHGVLVINEKVTAALAEGREPRVPAHAVLPTMRVLQQVQDEWDARHGARALPGRPLA